MSQELIDKLKIALITVCYEYGEVTGAYPCEISVRYRKYGCFDKAATHKNQVINKQNVEIILTPIDSASAQSDFYIIHRTSRGCSLGRDIYPG